jgi:hypothetical protein
MWLCTQHGFYSIVKKDDGFNVRGRVKRDLENLAKLVGLDLQVNRDYRYRQGQNLLGRVDSRMTWSFCPCV